MLKEESLEELIENQKVKEIIAKATELSFFVPIYIQEIIRMKLRKAKVDLPLPEAPAIPSFSFFAKDRLMLFRAFLPDG